MGDSWAVAVTLDLAIVTSGFPPDVGGVENVVGQLATGLAGLGDRVTVLTHGSLRSGEAPRPDGVRVERFRDWTHTRQFTVAPGLWAHLRRHGSEYELIHAHNFHASAALAAAMSTKQPLVFTPHFHGVGHTTTARAAHLAYDGLAARIFGRAAAVICVSNAEAQLLLAAYPDVGERIVVIPNGIDVAAISASEPFPVGRPVVLVGGRLEAYKQVDLAIQALPHVDPAVLLVVSGSGPELPRLKLTAARLGLADRVRFLGFVSSSDLHRWQRSASVTVSLSRHEAFGLAALEGAVAGSAVVASRIPAHVELMELMAGFGTLVDQDGTPEEIAAAISASISLRSPQPRPLPVATWADVSLRTRNVYTRALAR
jgi:glycosyltransferase involved in cell wall biosynthesis